MTKASWQIAADRSAVGAPIALTMEGGYTITPRKYTVAGSDAIQAITLRKQAGMKRDTLKLVIDNQGKETTRQDEQNLIMAVLADAPDELFAQRDLMRAELIHGVHEHTMEGEAKAPTPAWVDSILEYPELAAEIVGIVRAFNRPLAPRTPETSGMSPSGASQEPDTAPTPTTSPTDQTPTP